MSIKTMKSESKKAKLSSQIDNHLLGRIWGL